MRPKFKLPKYLIVSLIFYTLAACSSSPYVTVKTDYDHAAAFGKYHTYAIDMGSTRLGPTTAAALQSSLRSSLAARGLKESGRNADLYIVPIVFTKEQLNVLPERGFTVYSSRYGTYGRGHWAMNADVQQYTEGTLVIDFVDSRYRLSGRGEIGGELLQILAVVQNGVRGGIAHRAQILQIFLNSLDHNSRSLRTKTLIIPQPSQSKGTDAIEITLHR